MRGIKRPLLVEFISSKEEALGVVVPIPAAPVEGNVLVCGNAVFVVNRTTRREKMYFIKQVLISERIILQALLRRFVGCHNNFYYLRSSIPRQHTNPLSG
jgi:hypothetical protein